MNRTYHYGNNDVDDEDLEVESITKNIKEPYIEENNNEDGDGGGGDDGDDDVIIVPTTATGPLALTKDKRINDEKLNLFKSISSKTLDVLCDLDESNINDVKSDLYLIKNIRDYQRPTRSNMKTIDNTVSMIKYKLKRNTNNNRIRKKYRSEKLTNKEKLQCGRVVKSKINRFLKYPLMISGVVGTVAASTYFTGFNYPLVATAALSFNSLTNMLTQFDWASLLL
jgi:hypothetical protein